MVFFLAHPVYSEEDVSFLYIEKLIIITNNHWGILWFFQTSEAKYQLPQENLSSSPMPVCLLCADLRGRYQPAPHTGKFRQNPHTCAPTRCSLNTSLITDPAFSQFFPVRVNCLYLLFLWRDRLWVHVLPFQKEINLLFSSE